jgi:transcriptional regulator with XRE-family HTH domain
MEKINERVGSRLKEMRKDLGWSQQYIAGEIGMSQNNYSRIESGKAQITLWQLAQISRVFEKDMKELIPVYHID